mmetsp:Transcript_5368/g.13485  ORF Transcript_5368/g.13485 Transcript_5368/m.13485 type:complete len:214 (-) Transcript_5368:309-950(-)|eukprot:CAMPEP_0177681582 /NCGR_PEP_ID=MMETSP0447-20121125/30802_1 /TAXON_ID=0 /ORGANISM="Stygamoeba regulata, Strain BSH-02190019" /LENGTH=213 /DNA_ID=CAMNT_0019191027 /DNA_START=110 /DNA_END=751 /DNA_ORIENTATION=+
MSDNIGKDDGAGAKANYGIGKELASLDFSRMIGGPLVAVVNAQVQAAIATVNFVKTVGFEPVLGPAAIFSQTTGKAAMVTFEYQRMTAEGKPVAARVMVPFLTMMPIPSLRVDEVSIEFLAKINAVTSKAVDMKLAQTAVEQHNERGFDPTEEYLFSSAMETSAIYQKQTRLGTTVTRDYSLHVKVRCVQDELPAGIDKLLSILEGTIADLKG